jgi:hypothetical protein
MSLWMMTEATFKKYRPDCFIQWLIKDAICTPKYSEYRGTHIGLTSFNGFWSGRHLMKVIDFPDPEADLPFDPGPGGFVAWTRK